MLTNSHCGAGLGSHFFLAGCRLLLGFGRVLLRRNDHLFANYYIYLRLDQLDILKLRTLNLFDYWGLLTDPLGHTAPLD